MCEGNAENQKVVSELEGGKVVANAAMGVDIDIDADGKIRLKDPKTGPSSTQH